MTDTIIIKSLNEYAAQDYGIRAGQPIELRIGGKVVNDVHEAEEEHNVHMPRNIVTNITYKSSDSQTAYVENQLTLYYLKQPRRKE